MGEWTKELMALDEDLCLVDAKTGQWVIAEFDSGVDDERETDAACGMRAVACWNAMQNIPDPAAFMEEVRIGLDTIAGCERVQRVGGSLPEDLQEIEESLSEAVSVAVAILAKMEGQQ